jgi:hypothetical protein
MMDELVREELWIKILDVKTRWGKRCANKFGARGGKQKYALTATKSGTLFQARMAVKNAWQWATRGFICGCA